MTRVLIAMLGVAFAAGFCAGQDVPIPQQQAEQIEKAAPNAPRVKPARPRRVLIFNTPAHLLAGDPHKGHCTPYGNHAMKVLGTKTGAYEPVVSDDVTVLRPESIKRFDAIVFNNACGNWITPSDAQAEKLSDMGDKSAVEAALKRSFTEWLNKGGGVVLYHFALGANRKWPQFHQMIGARLAGHPWNEEVGIQVEEPNHPLVQAFAGKGFRFADELFQFADPYDRDKVRVLLSIDPYVTNMKPKNYTLRPDLDFPMAYVKAVGKGRVFYTVFGHRAETYMHPKMLQFYLDGIQFATGDLEATTGPLEWGAVTPSPAPFPGGARKDQSDPAESQVITDPRGRKLRTPTSAEIRKIEQAAPSVPPARPRRPRKLLVFGKLGTHPPNPFAAKAIEILGRKTRGFKTVLSDDPAMLLPRKITEFDAIFINNWHERAPLLPGNFKELSAHDQAEARKTQQLARNTLLAYVKYGGGVAGVHAATAAAKQWPEYGEMIGGYHAGQIGGNVAIRNEQPDHPVNAAFEGADWRINDEIYMFTEPYSRENVRVLLSLDFPKLQAAGKDPAKREDNDYAISWVRSYGKGRVFYCSLGHNPGTYWNPKYLAHVLAGIQYALGDLEAPDDPVATSR